MSLNRLQVIADLLLEEVRERFNKEPLNIEGLEFSDSLSEIIEKLIIVNIRAWKMEDEISKATTDSDIANIKRKLDYCFKFKRPKLILALNSYLDLYINKNHPKCISELNLKSYSGFKN